MLAAKVLKAKGQKCEHWIMLWKLKMGRYIHLAAVSAESWYLGLTDISVLAKMANFIGLSR